MFHKCLGIHPQNMSLGKNPNFKAAFGSLIDQATFAGICGTCTGSFRDFDALTYIFLHLRAYKSLKIPNIRFFLHIIFIGNRKKCSCVSTVNIEKCLLYVLHT